MNVIYSQWCHLYYQAASLLIISYNRLQTKLKSLVIWWQNLKEQKKRQKVVKGAKGWSIGRLVGLRPLIYANECEIPEKPKIFNGKVTCYCSWEHRVRQEEITF